MTVSWVGCLIAGVILLIVAYMAPVPAPINRILAVIGWILLVVGLIFLVLALVGTGGGVSALALAPLLG